MDVRLSMLEEFSSESAMTRSVLDVVPDSLLDYQAHPSLHSVRWNVSHLADIPSWCDMILKHDSFDVAPVDGPPHQSEEQRSTISAIATFDSNVEGARRIIESFPIESLDDAWSLLAGGQPLMTHPRWLIYRKYMINHVAHHRGHLLAYLRINGIETPQLYQ